MTRHPAKPPTPPDIVVVVALGLVLFGLWVSGTGPLAPPSSLSSAELGRWMHQRSPIEVALALVRIGAIIVLAHLLISVAVAVVARTSGIGGLGRLTTAITLPPFRRLVSGMAGVGLGALSVATSTPAVADPLAVVTSSISLTEGANTGPVQPRGPSGSVTLARTGTSTVTLVRPDDVDGSGGGLATLRRSDDLATSGIHGDGHEQPQTDSSVSSERIEPTEVDHVVLPGDHLWGLAEARLGVILSEPAPEETVERYWLQVVRANPQLADPDLLMPSEVIHLPPPASL
ncbi:MAG: hypothetical protein KDB09_02365 [Acidimicrobiales bacterium]|nr:hypothetical protein [Acidimicrobiales bacterium]